MTAHAHKEGVIATDARGEVLQRHFCTIQRCVQIANMDATGVKSSACQHTYCQGSLFTASLGTSKFMTLDLISSCYAQCFNQMSVSTFGRRRLKP